MGEEEFRELVESRWERLLGVAWLCAGSEHTARETLLSTFVSTHREWAEDGRTPASELTRDLIDRCRKVAPEMVATPGQDLLDDEARGPVDQARHELLDEATRLHFDQRAALALRHLEDLTDNEIAVALGSTTQHVASTLASSVGTLAARLGPEHKPDEVEPLLRPALWEHAESINSGDAWDQVQRAIGADRSHRRRLAAIVGSAALVALLGAGAVYAAGYLNADPKPRAAIVEHTATASERAGVDIRTWPLRGSLAHGHATELDQLRRTSREPGYKTERFIFAGDVGASHFVIATAEPVEGDADDLAFLIVWKGLRGAPIAGLQRGFSTQLGPFVAATRDSLGNAGDLLVLSPSDTRVGLISREPVYDAVTGLVSRSWETLTLTDGVGVARTGPMGAMGVALALDQATTGVLGDSLVRASPVVTHDQLVAEFARQHNLPVTQVAVLEKHTLPFDGTSVATGKSAQQTARLVTVRRPDGVVFRMGMLDVGPSSAPPTSSTVLTRFAPTAAATWRNRPQLLLARPMTATGARAPELLTIFAPGAQRIALSGVGTASLTMKRVGPGVFQGLPKSLLPELVTVTSYDAQNRALGSWPLQGRSDDDPFGESISPRR